MNTNCKFLRLAKHVLRYAENNDYENRASKTQIDRLSIERLVENKGKSTRLLVTIRLI